MIRIRQIKIGIDNDNLDEIKKKVSKILKISKSDIKKIRIIKKSIDAREKDENVFYVYEVDIEVLKEELILKHNKSKDIFISPNNKYEFKITGTKKLNHRPVIIGSGPAGLFCGYLLAKYGYSPLIIERGEQIEKRVATVEKFFKTGILNENSNIQFGEGGAGTFSDGKLNTLVKDKLNRGMEVFDIFVSNGAPLEIKYLSKPHIGTDLLRDVIMNIREKMKSMGAEFRYETCLTDICVKNNKIEKIVVNNNEEIETDVVVLAIGHSARDTIEMLYKRKVIMYPKSFAVGVRIEHPQRMINESQYGSFSKKIEPASYKLTYTTKNNRGVYSFCMCPGGYVINASSEKNRLVVNGMSNHKRDTENANSAIVVTVNPSDYGENPLDGIKFQRDLENKAFNIGNGKIPVQLYKDFKENITSIKFNEVKPVVKGEYILSNLNDILPKFITDSIKEAMPHFDKKIAGFASDDALVFGVESRTSSPVRINRNELFLSNISGIYPCGEGSGYAGGITTAAIDGIKVAEAIAQIYVNNSK